MKNEIKKTNNQEWGFFGTCIVNTNCTLAQAETIWNQACALLMSDYGLNGNQSRDLLDSKTGRHFADAMTCGDKIVVSLPSWAHISISEFKYYSPAK